MNKKAATKPAAPKGKKSSAKRPAKVVTLPKANENYIIRKGLHW